MFRRLHEEPGPGAAGANAGWAGCRTMADMRVGSLRSRMWLASLCVALVFIAPSSAQVAPQRPATYPGLPSETPEHVRAGDRRLRLRQARGDDPDARRREAAHGRPRAQGRQRRADSPDAHALRRHRADQPCAQRPPRPDPEWLRQRDRGDRRGRLHPRGAGRPRQVRLGRRLRDEPSAARPAESDAGRSRDRHVRHDRLAGEERAGEQRARSAFWASPTTGSCR